MNSYSIIHNYNDNAMYNPDFQFVNAALSYKQNKIDTNRAQLQNLYDQFSVLKVAKDVDQQYIEDRLKQVRDIANSYGAMDPSDDNFMSSMMNNVAQVLDDKVKTSILSTKRMQAEDAAWAKMRTEKPEQYSQLNHQYAISLSDRQRYLSSEDIGDMYLGGANTIEYRDLSKKLMDNLPKIQDMLKAKWIETGPQQGFFRSIDTYEAIPPSKMRDALGMLFDQKDLQQININAWGTYDRMSDEQLAEVYGNHFAPKLESAREELDAIDLALAKTGNDKMREQLLEKREVALNNINNVQNYSFDKVLASAGREAVYSTLYKDQYFNDILGAYSYEPRLVDRKVDEVQKANAEYQLKLDEFELSRQKAVESARHNMEMENIAKTKAGKKGDKNGNGVDDSEEVIYGSPSPETYQGTEEDFVYKHFENRNKTVANTVGALTAALPGFSEEKVRQLLKDPKVVAQIENMSNAGALNIGGKKIKLTPDIIATLTEYKTKVIHTPEAERLMAQNAGQVVQTTFEALSKSVKESLDIDVYGLPNFNFRLEKGKDGKFAYQFIEPGKGTHNYAHLAKTNAGGEGNEFTKKVYTALHMYRDPNISNANKMMIKEFIYQEVLPNLDKNGRNAVNSAMKGLRNVTTTKMGAKDYWLTEYTAGDTEKANYSSTYSGAGEGVLSMITTAAGYAANPVLASARGKLEAATSTDNPGLDKVIQQNFRQVNIAQNEIYAANNLLPENRPMYIREGNEKYEDLKRKAGVGLANYKDDIILQVVMKNGVPTDQVNIAYYQKQKAGQTPQLVVGATVPKNDLQGIVSFDTERYNSFDARVPEYAGSISLGNMQFDKDKKEMLRITNAGDYTLGLQRTSQEYQTWLGGIQQRAGDEGVQGAEQIIQAYKQGAYTFDLEPGNNGMYKFSMKLEGEEVFSKPFATRLDQKTVVDITTDARIWTEDVVKSYIFEMTK